MAVSTSTFKQVPISELKLAGYNPKRRTSPEKIKALASSIEGMGLIYPIAITRDYEVIDGHRRVAAFQLMKLQEIPAIIVEGNRNAIYAEVNAHSVRHTGNDHLNIYLSQPGALLPKLRNSLVAIEEKIGRPLIARMAAAGASIVYYRWAVEISSYCERKDPKFIRRIIAWMLHHKNSKLALSAIRMGIPARTVERAIAKNLRLAPTFKTAA